MNPDTHAQRVLIIVSSGPSTPARCAAPFHTATLLACMDAEVTLFLSGEGVQLAAAPSPTSCARWTAASRCATSSARPARPRARLLMCRQPGVNIDESELIEELDEISSGGELARLILESERVLTL